MPPKLKNYNECRQVVEEEMATRALSGGAIRRRLSKGYMEEDLMEIDLKSIFRAFSSLENWIMI